MVHLDAHGLKGARGGMLAHVLAVARHDACNQIRKLAGRLQGLRLPACDDRTRNRSRKALLAVKADHVADVALLGLRQPLSRRHAARGVHAHVERTVKAEGEAARSVVDLGGRDADVEKDAVGLMNADRGKRLRHRREGLVNDREPRIRPASGNLDRLGIAIERNEPSLRGQLFKNATRMTSAPECSVDVQSVRVSHKRLRRLLAQNRQMNECLAHARNSQTMEAEPTAPPRKFFTIRTRSPPHQARPRAPRVHAPQACFCPTTRSARPCRSAQPPCRGRTSA